MLAAWVIAGILSLTALARVLQAWRASLAVSRFYDASRIADLDRILLSQNHVPVTVMVAGGPSPAFAEQLDALCALKYPSMEVIAAVMAGTADDIEFNTLVEKLKLIRFAMVFRRDLASPEPIAAFRSKSQARLKLLRFTRETRSGLLNAAANLARTPLLLVVPEHTRLDAEALLALVRPVVQSGQAIKLVTGPVYPYVAPLEGKGGRNWFAPGCACRVGDFLTGFAGNPAGASAAAPAMHLVSRAAVLDAGGFRDTPEPEFDMASRIAGANPAAARQILDPVATATRPLTMAAAARASARTLSIGFVDRFLPLGKAPGGIFGSALDALAAFEIIALPLFAVLAVMSLADAAPLHALGYGAAAVALDALPGAVSAARAFGVMRIFDRRVLGLHVSYLAGFPLRLVLLPFVAAGELRTAIAARQRSRATANLDRRAEMAQVREEFQPLRPPVSGLFSTPTLEDNPGPPNARPLRAD